MRFRYRSSFLASVVDAPAWLCGASLALLSWLGCPEAAPSSSGTAADPGAGSAVEATDLPADPNGGAQPGEPEPPADADARPEEPADATIELIDTPEAEGDPATGGDPGAPDSDVAPDPYDEGSPGEELADVPGCGSVPEGGTQPCARTSAFGTCSGVATCLGTGQWSECSAPEPVKETCNKTDDDCDGLMDEA